MEALWDRLNQWCYVRLWFLGGTFDECVIMGALGPISGTQRSAFARFAQSLPKVMTVEFVDRAPTPADSIAYARACIEASSQAQRFLAEKMIECSDGLVGLASDPVS